MRMFKIPNIVPLIAVVLFLSGTCYSQPKSLRYDIRSTFVASSGNSAAFWAVSNKYGTISVNPNSALLRGGLFADFDTLRKNKFDYSYGLDVINRVDGKYKADLQQYFLKFKYKFLTLQGGRIEEYLGDQDSTLSSGGLLWSGNAQPMPKITIGILNYTPVPFTHGFLEIKGALSHGWFEKDAYVKHEWLHHKYIYLQAGGNLPVHVHFGFHHYAQWGGVSPDAGRLPSSFKDYLVVFMAKQIDGDTILANGNWQLKDEYSNRVGNHIGSRNFGLDFDFKSLRITFYYQTIFEDYSGYKWHNKQDGLWGLSIEMHKYQWFSNLAYEFLNTMDQSMSWEPDRILNLPDDYFNHYAYKSGWTYNDFSIGSPLITSPVLLKKMNIQGYSVFDYLRNNRVRAHHFACKGNVNNWFIYKLMGTYTSNKGTYFLPFPYTKESICTELEISKKFERFYHLEVSMVVANDFGSMYSNKGSVLLTIRKRGFFSKVE
jgi:hypothetical protein